MAAYATPGVYIEEIVKFPPSVAPVATAIPAFIGYTEKAIKKEARDLIDIPFRITSMLEYETYFGGAREEDTISATVVDETVTITPPTNPSPYLTYYMMQMYFANGGGPCYVVSVGDYTTGTVGLPDLDRGLSALETADEPTLILFPDATAMGSDTDFYGLYNNALTQCHKLQDRFTIIDTYESTDVAADSADLRAGISLEKDFLKYGAAYYPYLDTILDYIYSESTVTVDVTITDSDDIQAEVQAIIDSIDLVVFTDLTAEMSTLEADVAAASPAADALLLKPSLLNKIDEIISFVNGVISKLNTAVGLSRNNGVTTEANALDSWITTALEQAVVDLNTGKDEINAASSRATLSTAIDTLDPLLIGAASIDAQINTSITGATGEINVLLSSPDLPAGGTVVNAPTTLDLLKDTNDELYNKIKAEIGLVPVSLPPSSAIAGIYARVDGSRGVWKAPANVGLNYVIKPKVNISNDAQNGLNVDTIAGKSINAIRTFSGKGILVWGARTLTGNDNEWRYVSVRRFFNMAEESIKKATEQFVFEPNDKNTWVRVKAMIDNFLTAQWRAGALAGPTPEKAFYVKIGLGETMTAVDILEGNMIVEIGMAVVRPAEFIVLKFSHKMQEA